MIAALKRLVVAYLASWLFLLWSVLMFVAGAAAMYAAIVGALPSVIRDQVLA